MITTATTQQQPAFSCFSKKQKQKIKKIKKRIKSDYSYYIHIFTFPLDIMWILQCWLSLSATGDKKTDGAGGRMNVGRADEARWRTWMEKESALEGNLQETKWEFFISVSTSGRSSCLKFCGFWRTFSLLPSFGFSIWTGMDECAWRSLNVFRLAVWIEKPERSG